MECRAVLNQGLAYRSQVVMCVHLGVDDARVSKEAGGDTHTHTMVDSIRVCCTELICVGLNRQSQFLCLVYKRLHPGWA